MALSYDNTNDHLGQNDKSPRYMHSHGELADDGTLAVTTRTWTDLDLAGFHGGVNAEIFDANNTCIGRTDAHVFGVDGKWIGDSDRTDEWSFKFDAATAQQATSMRFTNSWDPQWFQSVQNTIKWVGVALSILENALNQSGNAEMS